MSSKQPDKNLSLFIKCLAGSLAAHVAAIVFLLEQPVWVGSLVENLLGKIPSRSLDLTLGSANIEDPKDTTWDLIFTKRPPARPFDLPKEILEVLRPQGEHAASPYVWHDPLSESPSVQYLTGGSFNISFEEDVANTTLSGLPIVQLGISQPNPLIESASLLAAPLLPDTFEQEKLSAYVAVSREESALPESSSPAAFEETIAVPPQAPRKDTAFAFVYAPPDLESLHLPSLILSVPAESKRPIFASLLPEMAPSAAISIEKETLFTSSPIQEAPALQKISQELLEAPPERFVPLTIAPKPRLSSSVLPVDETLSYVPNFTFGDRPAPHVQNYKLPDFPSIAEWHDLFAIDVHTVQRKNEEDFLFSVVLTPKKEAMAYALKQNFHFVIDCSQKSARHRMPIYKRGVARALGYLGSKQTFNIYLFDPHAVSFSNDLVPGTPKEISRAKDFLEKEKYKSKSRRTDLLSVLEYIANLPKKFDELHTIILISDGEVIPDKKKDDFNYWLKKLRGKVGLYAASVGSGRAFDLELFAAASGGKALNSPTNAAFARKLSKLVMDLQYPIAKELNVAIRSKNPSNPLTLASDDAILPPLFASQNYTIVGTAKSPEEFTFVLEGVAKDRFVEISKILSMKNAPKPATPITPLLLEKMAQGELAQYIQDGDRRFKNQAAKLLAGADGK